MAETSLLPTRTPEELGSAVRAAVEALRAGEPVALPTETVYGLAADARSPRAAARIFEAKERPSFDPLIVHLPDLGWLERVAYFADPDDPRREKMPSSQWGSFARHQRETVKRLTGAFWPGPLTLVLPRRSEMIPDIVAAGLGTVAVRMSAHPVFAAVAAAFGGPLAAPSANRFGRISPTTGAHAREELRGRIPLVLDAGPTAHGVESTIVRPESGCLQILRPGPVTAEQLAEFGNVIHLSGQAKDNRPEAPGMLESHYAPRTPLRLIDEGSGLPTGHEPARGALLAWRRRRPGFLAVETLSPAGNPREAAARLFAAMRRLDAAGADWIVAERVPTDGLGAAIMDRLTRAAAR